MHPPSYHFLKSDDSVYACTKYGVVQVVPAVCLRCNLVDYVALPSPVDAVGKYMKALTRNHRRCRFNPVDGTSEGWADRWTHAFTWIARQQETSQ